MGDDLPARRYKRLGAAIVVVCAMWIDHCSTDEPDELAGRPPARVLRRAVAQDPMQALMLGPPDVARPSRNWCGGSMP